MDTASDGRLRIGLIVVIFLLLVGMLLLYNEHKKVQEVVRVQFQAAREVLAASSFTERRTAVASQFGYLFDDCSDPALYNQTITKDSRNMSIAELKAAIALHAECGHIQEYENFLTLALFEKDVKRLGSLAPLFSREGDRKNASAIYAKWDNVLALEKERADVFSKLVDIQEAYWQTELKKALGTMSIAEREAEIGGLNFGANERLKRAETLTADVRKERTAERSLWDDTFGQAGSATD